MARAVTPQLPVPSRVKGVPTHRSPGYTAVGKFNHDHPFTDEFCPVSRARSILIIPEVLTKSHIVVFTNPPRYPLTSIRPVIIASHPRSSTGLVIGGHSIYLLEGSSLARGRCMPFVHCPEQMLTAPM